MPAISVARFREVVQGASDDLYGCVADEPPGKIRITLGFHVAPDGSVVDADVMRSDLPEGNALSCVVRTVLALRFPAPQHGPEGVRIVYPLRLVR